MCSEWRSCEQINQKQRVKNIMENPITIIRLVFKCIIFYSFDTSRHYFRNKTSAGYMFSYSTFNILHFKCILQN